MAEEGGQHVTQYDAHFAASGKPSRHDELLLAQLQKLAAHDAGMPVQPIKERITVMLK